jgi:hypothetical protein
MASLLKAELASAEENDDNVHNHYDFAIAAACSLKSINKEVSKEDFKCIDVTNSFASSCCIELHYLTTCWSLLQEVWNSTCGVTLIHGS